MGREKIPNGSGPRHSFVGTSLLSSYRAQEIGVGVDGGGSDFFILLVFKAGRAGVAQWVSEWK